MPAEKKFQSLTVSRAIVMKVLEIDELFKMYVNKIKTGNVGYGNGMDNENKLDDLFVYFVLSVKVS